MKNLTILIAMSLAVLASQQVNSQDSTGSGGTLLLHYSKDCRVSLVVFIVTVLEWSGF